MKVLPPALTLALLLLFFPGKASADNTDDLWQSWSTNDEARERAANSVSGGASELATLGEKHFTPSQLRSITSGNAVKRGRMARRLNSAAKYFKSPRINSVTTSAGILADLADGGATALGHASVGDFSGAGAVIINETAKKGPSLAGALTIGKAGAAAGTFIAGPIGTAVGGAVGAIVGGVAGSAAYNAMVGDDLKRLAESALSFPELTPKLQALVSRAEHLEKKRTTDAMRALGWEDLPDDEVLIIPERPGIEDMIRQLPPTTPTTEPGDDNGSFWADSNEQTGTSETDTDNVPSTAETATAGTPPAPDDTRPVIPENCTIEALIWGSETPEHKAQLTYQIASGVVSFAFTNDYPAYHSDSGTHDCSAFSLRDEGHGQLKDNIISFTSAGRYVPPQKCVWTGTRSERRGDEWVPVPYRCESIMETNTTGSGEITFHIDHTITGRYTSRIFPKYSIRGENCPTENYNMQETWDKHNVSAPHSGTFIGTWKIRK